MTVFEEVSPSSTNVGSNNGDDNGDDNGDGNGTSDAPHVPRRPLSPTTCRPHPALMALATLTAPPNATTHTLPQNGAIIVNGLDAISLEQVNGEFLIPGVATMGFEQKQAVAQEVSVA